ncbi:MAG: hypothetical protein JOZ40_07215, partial [Methylobacteriaceae bacterium]|nr:hypothetical protein [Methylobacteriaceae bacterium]
MIHDFDLGSGIFVQTQGSTSAELYLSDTVLADNGLEGAGAGIIVRPFVSNTVSKVVLNRVEIEGNFFGIKADGTQVTGGVINMTIRDSV